MDPAALGERCLEHLAEMDRQMSLCSNISGIVAGRMKDSGIIASEITRAMIEKLTTVGDVISLRNENFSLKEGLDEIKRREQAQCKEIQTLRKMISNLEREVRSLKEGFGPFPSMMPPSTQPESKTPKRLSTPEKRHEKKRREKDILPSSQQQEECLDMEIEPLLNNTPGCSTNEEYMNRRMDWPQGGDSTPWSADAIGVKRDANININAKTNPNTYSNIYTNTNTNVTRDKKSMVKTAELTKPYNKGIRLVENRRLVPPSHPSLRNAEWVNVTGKRRRI